MKRIILVALCGLLAGSTAFAESRTGVLVHTAKPYDRVVQAIEGMGGEVTHQYQYVDGLAAQIPGDKLAELQGIRGVDYVEKDLIVQTPKPREDVYGNFELQGGEAIGASEAAAYGMDISNPENYYSYLSSSTGAIDTWAATGAGDDAIVAIIDSGTQEDHVCLAGRVIEGPDFTGDPAPFDSSVNSGNGFHGTFVGGMVASDCAFVIADGDPFDLFLPPEAKIDDVPAPGLSLVPLWGIAPEANMYAVKVFSAFGGGSPNSRINLAIEHVIDEKLSGGVDSDVINMSLGGASLADGKTMQEKLVDAATDAGITVVISAGNDGPAPTTVGAPGTAYSAVTVAAATDTVHTRIYWEYFEGPGAGTTLYGADELRISDFSGQGPLADGRTGPDITATGVFNFGPFIGPSGTGLGWSSGTSFSGPQVAGAAALLADWAKNNDPKIDSRAIKNALMDGAVPMDSEWSPFAQGQGFLNVPNSLALLESGDYNRGKRRSSLDGKLEPNVDFSGGDIVCEAGVTLERGRWQSWVLEVDEYTSKVTIDVDPADNPIPGGPSGAFGFPESFELFVHSAKRGGVTADLVDTANIFDDASVEISGGSKVFFGAIGGDFSNPVPPPIMEPGLMKVVLQSDWTNNTQFLTADVCITREQLAVPDTSGATLTLGDGESVFIPVDVPGGASSATFTLEWSHDWTKVPTSDFDLLFVSPSSFPFLDFTYLDAASLNAPEQQTIASPEAGTWYVLIDAFSLNKGGKDPVTLKVDID